MQLGQKTSNSLGWSIALVSVSLCAVFGAGVASPVPQHAANKRSHHSTQTTTLAQFGEQLVINESNWRHAVAAIADDKQRIIFTTFKGVNSIMKKTNANFYFWLHQQNLSSNLLLLSEEQASCEMLWEIGVPCWVDNFCPRGDKLPPGQYQDDRNHWYCKYWWAAQLLRNGNTALFMDNDNIVLQNPYEGSDPASYDFEALSDWVRNLDRPTPREFLENPCGGYKAFNFPGGQQLMNQDYDQAGTVALAVTPCVSAGLWFAYPRDTTIKYFDDLLEWLVAKTEPDQWDQAAFNEVLTAHLVNVRDASETLKFRLLPHKNFVNLPVYESKLEGGLELNEIVVHPCCVGHGKEENLNRIGLWKPDAWRPQLGLAIAKRYVSCMADQHSTECANRLHSKDPVAHFLADNIAWKNSMRPSPNTASSRKTLRR